MKHLFHWARSCNKCHIDQRGSVMIITALSAVVMISVMGLGIDLGRQQLVRIKIQQATDAAAQAAIQSTADREQIALTYFNMNYPLNYMGLARPTPIITTTGGKVSVSASMNIPMIFMQVTGVVAVASSAVTELPIPNNIIISPLYCFGHNGFGAAGNGTANSYKSPTPVILPAGVKSVKSLRVGSWDSSSCTITDENVTYCWGKNRFGNNGDGTTNQSNVATPVVMPPGVKFIKLSDSAGINEGDHVCAIGDDGNAYCWGWGYFGQIGDGFIHQDRYIPTKVIKPIGVTSFIEIAVGYHHSCAIADDDNTYCWGNSAEYDNLGFDSPIFSVFPTPQKVTKPAGVNKFIKIDAEHVNTCAIADNGLVYCWGQPAFGAIGDGSGTAKTLPTMAALPNHNYVQISVGFASACALANNGELYCWGRNRRGNIGNGTADYSGNGSVFSLTPEKVLLPAGISGFKSVSVGFEHACAIGMDDKGYCWGGHGGFGPLSSVTSSDDNPTPLKVDMPPGVSAYTNIQAGGFLTCAQVDVP